jgi:starch-binding outer membrane protein, SusD/RagB family
MKKLYPMKYILYSVIIVALVGIASCDEGLLDPNFDGSLTDEQVWSDPDFAEGVLIQAYSGIPSFYAHYSGQFLDVATDNAVTNRYEASIYNVATGGWTAAVNPVGSWNNDYQHLYHINLFLEKGLDAPFSRINEKKRKEIRDRLVGEAYFLRAYYHFRLLRAYAGPDGSGNMLGVPILTEALEPDQLFLPRASYEAVVDQIVTDCDSAAALLPPGYFIGADKWLNDTQTGRADSVAALALKSRVLLYAASPAYNTEKEQQKWIDAAEAAYEAIQAIGGDLPPLNYSKPGDLYHNPNHKEIILRRYAENNWMENNNFMPILYGQGQTSPSHNLVQAFPMINGFLIDNSQSNYDPQNPYQNRDPRLYATVLFDGAGFKGEMIKTHEGGRDASGSSVNSTRTGYYLRKWMSSEVNLKPGEINSDKHYFALFRKTELFLNFAEASNEAWGPQTAGTGMSMTAEGAMQMMWDRVGYISDFPLQIAALKGKEGFRDLIHNQRRLEFAFEGHRFFDLRRWKVSMNKLNAQVLGVKIPEDGGFLSTFVVEERDYKDYMYYGPLPYDEVIKNDQLVQNAGW